MDTLPQQNNLETPLPQESVAILLNNRGVDILVEDPSKNVSKAIELFEESLALILRNTQMHYEEGCLVYGADEHGVIEYEEEGLGEKLVASVRLCETGIQIRGRRRLNEGGRMDIDDDDHDCDVNGGDCSTFIYWKALKIVAGDEDGRNCGGNSHRRDYEFLSVSIFHIMICTFNLALAYQYKGIQNSSRRLLNSAAERYIGAYELLTRFRLEDMTHYTLLLAVMNNMANTYSFLNDDSRLGVCNRYLLSTLILVTSETSLLLVDPSAPSSSLSSSSLSPSNDTPLTRVDRKTFESFLANVMHLILNERPVASAA